MAPDSIDASVQVDKKPEVKVEEQSLGELPSVVTVRPFSVNILLPSAVTRMSI